MSYSIITSESINMANNRLHCNEDSDMDVDLSSKLTLFWNDETSDEKISDHLCEDSKLLQLPEEIIYLIFSFLAVKDLVFGVKMACKLFNQMLSEYYFKRRMRQFLGVKEFPRVFKALSIDYGDNPVSWKNACFNYEDEYNKWSDPGFEKILKKDFSNNTSSVDIAKIVGNGKLLMSGGRDRILSLWNVEKCPRLLSFNERIHSGWIWDIVSSNDKAFSCDWDGKIFEWSLEKELGKANCNYEIGRPILCLALKEDENLLVAGLQTGELCFIDPRSSGPEVHRSERVHRSAVMGVQIIGSSIASISEDKTLSVYDFKNCRQMKKSRVAGGSIPVSMSKNNSAIFVAQTSGCISLINAYTYKIWETYTAINSRLTSIYASQLGLLITASRDKQVTIYSPGKQLSLIRNIHIGAEVAKIDYNHGILAIARSDNKVSIFNTNIKSY